MSSHLRKSHDTFTNVLTALRISPTILAEYSINECGKKENGTEKMRHNARNRESIPETERLDFTSAVR